MNMENINLTEAIIMVSSYRNSLQDLANKIQKTFTLQRFEFEVKQICSIGKMLEELNLKYKINKRNNELTLYNEFDPELKAKVILKNGDQHESISN